MMRKLLNKIKFFYIKFRHGRVSFDGEPIIMGKLPHIKLVGSGKVTFGKKVVINSDFSSTNTALTYRCKFVTGYEGNIVVGDNTMFNGVCIVSYKKITIGNNCQIASSTMIADTDFHPVDPKYRLLQVKGEFFPHATVKNEDIRIGDNVWIGWNCTVLKGVEIGDNSIVAAGSVVVSGIYPSNCLIAGNPAKVVKPL